MGHTKCVQNVMTVGHKIHGLAQIGDYVIRITANCRFANTISVASEEVATVQCSAANCLNYAGTSKVSFISILPQTSFSSCKKTLYLHYVIHPIHAAAMFNRMRGLEGKYARHCVNRDVT